MLVGSSTPCPFRLIPPPRSHSFFSGVSDATIYTLTCFLCNRCLGRGAEFRERRDRVHIETYVLSSVFSGHLRQGYCTVSHDNFIYFIGGGERYPNMSSVIRIVSNVHRYDLHANQWDKCADTQVARPSQLSTICQGFVVCKTGVILASERSVFSR